MISVSRELLAIDLRTYGEDALAGRVISLTDEDMRRIGQIASAHADTGMLFAKALSLAAIEVMEGRARAPRWSRRKLKGIYPEQELHDVSQTPRVPISDVGAAGRSPGKYATSKAMEQAIFDSLVPKLQALGFRKREWGILTKDLNVEVIGWLGIPAGLDRMSVYVDMYVNVGVRHQPTERLVAELTEKRSHPHSPASLAISIDSLRIVKEHLGWRFSGDAEIDETVDDIVSAVRECALPWMMGHATLEAMLTELIKHPHWQMPSGGDSTWPLRVPVMHALCGNPEEGVKLVQRVLDDIAATEGAWVDYYRRFAANFLGRFQQVRP